jgi:hypothetical protein
MPTCAHFRFGKTVGAAPPSVFSVFFNTHTINTVYVSHVRSRGASGRSRI